LEFLALAGDQLSAPERLSELHTAVWLDPTNPYTGDLYARALLQQGIMVQALNEITQSILASPVRSTHFYLGDPIIFLLSAREKAAIEQGFKQALERHERGAVEGLAEYYNAQHRYVGAAEDYARAATSERDRALRESYLIDAGVAYAQAGDFTRAQTLFDQEITQDPADERPYRYLVTLVLGPRHDLKAAQSVIARGVREGADAAVLYDALATVAQTDNDRDLTEAALKESVAARPTYPALFHLGMFYLDDAKYSRAALIMRRATASFPQSADAYFYLAVAEERDYRFSEAEKDFSRAVKLAPSNVGFRDHYADFEHKVAESVPASPPLSE
jgi:tetratricopeptide (TPR) repeat protein